MYIYIHTTFSDTPKCHIQYIPSIFHGRLGTLPTTSPQTGLLTFFSSVIPVDTRYCWFADIGSPVNLQLLWVPWLNKPHFFMARRAWLRRWRCSLVSGSGRDIASATPNYQPTLWLLTSITSAKVERRPNWALALALVSRSTEYPHCMRFGMKYGLFAGLKRGYTLLTNL